MSSQIQAFVHAVRAAQSDNSPDGRAVMWSEIAPAAQRLSASPQVPNDLKAFVFQDLSDRQQRRPRIIASDIGPNPWVEVPKLAQRHDKGPEGFWNDAPRGADRGVMSFVNPARRALARGRTIRGRRVEQWLQALANSGTPPNIAAALVENFRVVNRSKIDSDANSALNDFAMARGGMGWRLP